MPYVSQSNLNSIYGLNYLKVSLLKVYLTIHKFDTVCEKHTLILILHLMMAIQKFQGTTYRSSHQRRSVKKVFSQKFRKIHRKHLCQSLFFNKVGGLRPAHLLKNRLWHRCSPVNFAKFQRTPFLKQHLWWLLLNLIRSVDPSNSERGSVCIYYKNFLHLRVLQIQYLHECINIELKIGDKLYNSMALQRSPSQWQDSFAKFSEKLESNLDSLVQKIPSQWC